MTFQVAHTSFMIERDFAAPPARVFRAWSNPELRKRWTDCHPETASRTHTLDFRTGGEERVEMRLAGGGGSSARFHYFDIVPDERIVYGYELEADGRRLSVSLVTVVLQPSPDGTRMSYTEQVVLLDPAAGIAERIEGTHEGFERLAGLLAH
jgi:uncharacterized protein YndB with AHSA1/START domain